MARNKKPSPAPSVPGALSDAVFAEFLKTISNTKQRISDAQTDHAREFTKCESLGIHADATKLMQRLDKMSEEKRADFLHFFDMVRPWMGWDEQLDLLEHAADQPAAVVAEPEDEHQSIAASADEDETERGPAELTFASAEREEADPLLEETSEEWEASEAGAENEEDFDKGGYTFAEGKASGQRGEDADFNPHPAGNPSHGLWERGRTVGFKEFVAAEAVAVADEHEAEEGDSGSEAIEQDDDANVVNLFGDDAEGEDGEVGLAAAALTGNADASHAAQ